MVDFSNLNNRRSILNQRETAYYVTKYENTKQILNTLQSHRPVFI